MLTDVKHHFKQTRYEPVHEIINNLGSDHVRHKTGRAAKEGMFVEFHPFKKNDSGSLTERKTFPPL